MKKEVENNQSDNAPVLNIDGVRHMLIIMKELIKQYNRVAQAAKQHKTACAILDEMIQNHWGFNFSETDDDRIIDTLDYGTDSLTAKDFIEKMNQYKENFESTGDFGCVI